MCSHRFLRLLSPVAGRVAGPCPNWGAWAVRQELRSARRTALESARDWTQTWQSVVIYSSKKGQRSTVFLHSSGEGHTKRA